MFSKGAKSHFALAVVFMASLLQACSGGGSNDSVEVDPNTVSIGGTIEGLAGEITVSINGSEEVLNTNGDFTFSTRVTIQEDFVIRLVDAPTGLVCSIENSSGTATANISNVAISCSGLEARAYSLNNLGFSEESPSVLTFAFHLVNRITGRAIEDLTTDNVTDYLIVTENQLPISKTESFLEVDPLVGLNATYTTVFAIDISASLTQANLAQVVSSIKDTVADANGNSLLEANQRVSIFTFDSTIENILEPSQDIQNIFDALDNIEVGGNSTNLFGAIKQSADSWTNEVSPDLISYGSLILFTDGNDNSELVSKDEALSSVASKDVYFIVLGNESNTDTLAEFTPESNIFSIEDFNELNTVLSSALDFAKSYENGLYVLSYATPKRAGNHLLTIAPNDDYDCNTSVNDAETQQMSDTGFISDCIDSVSHNFDANGYTDISPQLELSGVKTTISTSADWQARVRWTNSDVDLSWQVERCIGDISYSLSEDKKIATFERQIDDFSMVYIKVTDENSSVSEEGYLQMSSTEGDFKLVKNQRNSDLCNR
ncbi:hypothetical protein GCM10009128_08600 [Psychrosphaera haliotis]|uniref:vWA domain-containing protein n=1 Tax=Psychrosphaera haliotis TaxID=555083 RepID=UPI0031D84764